MACPTLLCAVILLYQIQGSRAGTPMFVPTGGDLNLDVSEAAVPKTFYLFLWKFKTENVMVTFQSNGEPTIDQKYRGRIEDSEKKYSVRLKTLTKGDSGTYVARVIANKELTLAEYDVTVQDPVSPVVLTSDSVLNTSSSCNVSATCTTSDSSISSSFRCDAKSCYQERGGGSEVTRSGHSLHIYLSAESIICNHSNQVSWLKNETSLRPFCPKFAEMRIPVLRVVITMIIFAILIVAATVFWVWPNRDATKSVNETQVDAAEVDFSTTYSLVGSSTENTKQRSLSDERN